MARPSFTRRLTSRSKFTTWIFCDESGNSGPNYLEKESPFLVVGGFIVSGVERRKAAEKVVMQFVDSLRLQANTEPKFRTVWRGARKESVLQMMHNLSRTRVMPVFHVMDKEFSIAGKIVDVLLDPVYNPSASWLPTSALREREELVIFLSATIDRQILQDFALAYRDPSENRGMLVSVLERLVEAVTPVRPQLGSGFAGAIVALDEIIMHEDYQALGLGEHYEYASLNLPAFSQFIRKCDMILEIYRPTRGILIHDNQVQFRRVFEESFAAQKRMGLQGPPGLDRLLDGMAIDRLGIRNIQKLEMRDSRSEALLLASDILASGINMLFRKIRESEPWDETDLRFAGFFIPALLGEKEATATFYASYDLIGEALSRVMLIPKKSSVDDFGST